MSRSYRKNPHHYWCGCTPSLYKRQVNRQMRRTVNNKLMFVDDDTILPEKLDQVDDIWGSPMDGKKVWTNPKSEWAIKHMRKK
jgi:hypothetical protein